jgi:hypothetical protein
MKPRLGFLGVGWIGRHRMEAMIATGAIEVAAIADPSPEMAAEALKLAPAAQQVAGLAELLDMGLDGIVIATPSALHAEQSIQALERGAAVFCQKPLGRTAAEARAVIDAAKRAIACSPWTCPTASPKAWAASASCCNAANWAGSLRSIWCSTMPTAPTRTGSTIPRCRAAAAWSILACIWSIWRSGHWTSRQ